jgi:hypothetical protein
LSESYKIELENIRLLWSATVEELKRLKELLEDNKFNDSFYRRLFLKSIYSAIESYLHICKKIIIFIIAYESNSMSLDWSELMILKEKKPYLDNKGKVKLKNEFQSFEANLRFTLNAALNVFKSNPADYGDKGFQKLILISKKRNDITHPKDFQDFVIKKEEFTDLLAAFGWFVNLQNEISDKFELWLKDKISNH